MVKILIAGDFAPRARVTKLIEEEKYGEIFDEVIPYTSSADYSVVNLEAPIVDSSTAKPIKKCGPNLMCSTKAIDALKYAGFDMVTLANNHFYDYGEYGVKETLSACKLNNIDVVGGGANIKEASQILYKEVNGIKIAFINCCESEFSIATEVSGGANPLNPIKQYYAIQEAKRCANKVIVIVHGGHEHYQLPSIRMKETYRFFVDAGADVVVNHHQHCYSGYEHYNGKLIFYGLGNFCFDWRNRNPKLWSEGYMLMLELGDSDQLFKIHPYRQCLDFPSINMLGDITEFQDRINVLNTIISDDHKLSLQLERYYSQEDRNIFGIIEPLQNRYIIALQKRKLFPSFQSRSWLLKLYNYFMCESHRDKLAHYFKKRIL